MHPFAVSVFAWANNNHSPQGKQQVLFPETLNVSRGEVEGNIEVQLKQKLSVSRGASHLVPVLLPSNSVKSKIKLCRNHLFCTDWLIKLLRFPGARPDHVRVKSLCCCFPRELVSFDPGHVTHFPPIRKRI